MIKNDNGEIEVSGAKVPELILEWMQLTQAIAIGITDQTCVEMDLERMVSYGAELLKKLEEDGENVQ